MSNKKVSDLADGGAVQDTDEFYAQRGSSQVKIAGSEIGGSLTLTQESFSNSSAHDTVAGNSLLTWIKTGGDDLVDLANPLKPTIVETGLYQVSVLVHAVAEDTFISTYFWVGLDLDIDGDDIAFFDVLAPLDPDVQSGIAQAVPPLAELTAGAAIQTRVRHNEGSDLTFWQQGFIQRIA